MADDIRRAVEREVGPDRWSLIVLAVGFAMGAVIGLGLPAIVAYHLRADTLEIPGEWRTTAPAGGDATSIGAGGSQAP